MRVEGGYRTRPSCFPALVIRRICLMRVSLSFASMLLALTVGQPSTAATIAVLPGVGGFQNANYGANGTIGWGFTLASPLTVTDLGYFDGDSGLVDPHPVGIWDSNGNL